MSNRLCFFAITRGVGAKVLTGRQPSKFSPMVLAIRIAVEFIQHAQRRDTPQALGLIDLQLFERRLLDPEGSHEAVAYGLSSDHVLDRLSQYSLEGTGKSGGRRQWRLLGPTSFGGLPAIIVRYHSEAESASSALLAIKKDFELVADLLPWEEFEPRPNSHRDMCPASTPHKPAL